MQSALQRSCRTRFRLATSNSRSRVSRRRAAEAPPHHAARQKLEERKHRVGDEVNRMRDESNRIRRCEFQDVLQALELAKHCTEVAPPAKRLGQCPCMCSDILRYVSLAAEVPAATRAR